MIDLCQPCNDRGKFRVPTMKWRGIDVCGDCYAEKEGKEGKPARTQDLECILGEKLAQRILKKPKESEKVSMSKTGPMSTGASPWNPLESAITELQKRREQLVLQIAKLDAAIATLKEVNNGPV